jgi:hypothetical protein
MANEQEAAVKASMNALHQSDAFGVRGKSSRNYVVQARVYEDCWAPAEPGEPTPKPEGEESVTARLDRIEAQLQRVLAMLEQGRS